MSDAAPRRGPVAAAAAVLCAAVLISSPFCMFAAGEGEGQTQAAIGRDNEGNLALNSAAGQASPATGSMGSYAYTAKSAEHWRSCFMVSPRHCSSA